MRPLAPPGLLLALLLPAPPPRPRRPPAPHEYVQAVEFPYYLYPRALWERELVWLKTIGVRTVEFSIPWNWHQMAPGDYDFTGRTSPRRDLVAFIQLLRRLDLRAWVRPLPPVAGWRDQGTPAAADAAARARLAQAARTVAGHPDRQPRRPHRLCGRPRPGHRCRRPARAR